MAAATNPAYVEQVQSNIPAWMQPYAQQLLGSVFGGQDPTTGKFIPGLVGQGYQPYMVPKRDAQGNILKDDSGKAIMQPGQRFAEFTPLQQRAFDSMAGMRVSPELGQAAGIAGLAAGRAAQLGQYTPYAGGQNFYDSPQFREMQTNFERVSPTALQQYQMDDLGAMGQVSAGGISARDIAAQAYKGEDLKPYMSSYMQDVVDLQKEQAIRDYGRQIPGLKAAGVRAGARGGTRETLLEAENRRNLQQGMRDIQATGSQRAFESAQAQYAADRARALQAEMANQQAGLQAGTASAQMGLQAALANQQTAYNRAAQNLAAKLGTQQLGAQQGLQAGLANQQSQLQAQQQALAQLAAANQFSQQNAQQRAQYGLAGANLAEQSRQFGAGLGLQGLQQQLAAAGMLGNLGQQRYGQEMGIMQGQLGMGGQQQAFNQQMLNQMYQDFINQQQFPYKQAEFAMGILRGLPTDASRSMYQQAPSIFNQIAGAGMMGIGGLFGGLGQTT
jgi:hypothetical protein